jgi:hypothetical protein
LWTWQRERPQDPIAPGTSDDMLPGTGAVPKAASEEVGCQRRPAGPCQSGMQHPHLLAELVIEDAEVQVHNIKHQYICRHTRTVS